MHGMLETRAGRVHFLRAFVALCTGPGELGRAQVAAEHLRASQVSLWPRLCLVHQPAGPRTELHGPGLGRRITLRPHAPSVGLVGSSISFVYIATTSVEMGAWHDGSQATTSCVSLRWAAAPARIVAHGPPNPSGPSLVSGRRAARVVVAAVAPACTAGWPGC